MYNNELVNVLIKYKEKQLKELKINPSSSPIEIKKVEDELKSLEIYNIRYEMAKILKLDEDKDLKTTNYEGIENKNPSSMQFNLSVTEVARFNSLRNKLLQLKRSNNFTIQNIDEITKEAKEQLIKKLNTMKNDDYSNNKQEDLDTLFKLLDSNNDEKSFSEINNYEFAYDILKKYPNSKISLSFDQILELIELLDHDDKIKEDKYADYIKLLVDNINALIDANTNLDEIKEILDRINKSNYSLRIDLSKSIKEEKIKLNNSDIDGLFAYLNKNYDALSEDKRNKLFSYLNERMIADLRDPESADRINKLIEGASNNNLRERLRESLKSESNAIFKDQHVNSYSNLISEKIRKLEARKQKYLNRTTNIEAFDIMYKTKAKEIDREIERLRQLSLSYDDSYVIGQLDEQYNSKKTKIIKIEKEINELNKLKADLKSEFQKKRIERRIKKLESKINSLKKSEVKIEGIQKKIMTPKMFVEIKRGMINKHFESRSEVYSEFADDYEKMSEKETEINGMFSGIKAAFYEYKAGRYRSKSEFNRKIYEMLSKPGTRIQATGSNKKKLNKKDINILQQQMQNQNQDQQQAQMAA